MLGGLGGLLVASGILLINDSRRARLIPWLVSYAVGAVLGVSMLAILPEALDSLPASRVFGPRETGALAALPHSRLRSA
jgi:zinc and cadmium transporter